MLLGALEFHLTHGDRPWAPTRAWAVPDPDGGQGLEDWALTLDPPDPGTPALPLHDLKRWLLFGNKDKRYLVLNPNDKDLTDAREVSRDEAAEMYLRGLLGSVPRAKQSERTTVLMPSLDNDKMRERYLAMIDGAIPNARVLPEPEMVVEYFRLVSGALELDRDHNNTILVIDVGASTCDLTLVFSTRQGEIVTGETTRRRVGRLQASQGSSSAIAGQWADERLAEDLGLLDSDEPLDDAERLQLLDEVERAKIEVSRGRGSVEVRGQTMTPGHLEDLSIDLVSELEPVINTMRARLWKQQTGTDYAQELSLPIRQERGVDGEADALKLVDWVLLAGGTSQLPGFEAVVRTLFDDSTTRFRQVGDAFPVAAAVGALAHVLHSKYDPPRLRSDREAGDDDLPEDLEGAIDVDIELEWQTAPRTNRARKELVLERGDPLAYTGGRREAVLTLDVDKDQRLRARFIPNVEKGKDRKGIQPQRLTAVEDAPTVDIEINRDRKLTMQSDGLRGTAGIWLDLSRFDKKSSPSPSRYTGEIPPGQRALDLADELVIDFGMSKSVVVGPAVGLIDPSALERACRGEPPPEPGAENRPDPIEHAAEGTGSAQEPEGTVDDSHSPRHEPWTKEAGEARPPDEEPPPAEGTAPQEGVSPANGSGTEEQLQQGASASAPIIDSDAPERPSAPLPRVPADEWVPALGGFLRAATEVDLEVPSGDLVMTLLALAVRRTVLLAGPPGAGKSMLARMVAHLLGRALGHSFHEVPVQAHWTNDGPLFGPGGSLRKLTEQVDDGTEHLILFDEINLTRPEYFLTRYFHAVDRNGMADQDCPGVLRLPPVLALGTLNIDDTSRAPSPKVIDRCMLVEVDQVDDRPLVRTSTTRTLRSLPTLPGLPSTEGADHPDEDERLTKVRAEVYRVVREHGLRQDLLPSRRARHDIQQICALHRAAGPELGKLLAHDDLVDRLICSRILVRVAGADEQVEPVLGAMEKLLSKEPQNSLPLVRRRIALSKRQLRLGFVSPWQ